jgi:plastocyanin
MAGMMFYPTTLTVSKGTTVTWQNNDAITHTSTSDAPGIWDTGDITSNSSKTVTFNTAGTFRYHCIYHVNMGMRGTIIVQ